MTYADFLGWPSHGLIEGIRHGLITVPDRLSATEDINGLITMESSDYLSMLHFLPVDFRDMWSRIQLSAPWYAVDGVVLFQSTNTHHCTATLQIRSERHDETQPKFVEYAMLNGNTVPTHRIEWYHDLRYPKDSLLIPDPSMVSACVDALAVSMGVL